MTQEVSIFDAYVEMWRMGLTFEGRTRRRNFWFAVLVDWGLTVLLRLIPTLGMIYAIVSFIPMLALTVRRLHDTGRAGAWMLILLIPVIGWVVLLIFTILEGDIGENIYGMNPKDYQP